MCAVGVDDARTVRDERALGVVVTCAVDVDVGRAEAVADACEVLETVLEVEACAVDVDDECAVRVVDG